MKGNYTIEGEMEIEHGSYFPDDSFVFANEAKSSSEVIRETIKDKVNSILWFDKLVEEEKLYEERLKRVKSVSEKCMICTLPYGSCVHTKDWIEQSYQARTSYYDEDLDKTIDDMLSVIGEFKVETAPVLDDVDLNQMQWSALDERPTDKIGSTNVCLFSPDERGWHSTVKLAEHLIFVFGGFKYRKNKVPQPFSSVPLPEEVEYLNDIRVYDTQHLAWHGVRARGRPKGNEGNAGSMSTEEEEIEEDEGAEFSQPEGRYGHVAAALDDNRMFIFGGRGVGGRILNDSWVYNYAEDRWTIIQYNEAMQLPVPPARFFGSAVSVRIPRPSLARATSSIYCQLKESDRDVYLFGGTDGMDNFGDLWVFRGSESVLRWERLVAVGLPPCPRYGHQMLLLHENDDGIEGPQLMVLGGCSVSPQGEMVGSNLAPCETQQLLALSSELRKRYQEESRFAYESGAALESNVLLEMQPKAGHSSTSTIAGGLKLGDVYHQAGAITAAMHLVEAQTRTAEQQMADAWKIASATTRHNIKKARHPTAQVDSFILNLTELIWKSQTFPGVRGDIPSARIHFSASCIGHIVFVMGGAEPTSLRYRHVESDGQTAVYVLDSRTMKWSIGHVSNSQDHLKEPLRIAQADVIRALRKCDEEKLRGISLGALNGRTVELAEAKAVLEVCKWRLQTLQTEQKEQSSAPPARWGASLLAQGQRMVFVGGWEAERAVPKGKSVVLNVEQEHERQRRLGDEFNAKLQRERLRDQAQARMEHIQSTYELRAILQAEQDNQARERRRMHIEDILSSLPPLSQPESVQFVQANKHTIWVKWPRIQRNSKRQLIDAESITYFLYVRTSYESLNVNDRVFATVPPAMAKRAPSRKAHHNKSKRGGSGGFDHENVFFDDDCKRFPAEITKIGNDGKFDLLFDDGTVEKGVGRHRLKAAPALDLTEVVPLISRPNTAMMVRPGTGNSVNSNSSGNGMLSLVSAATPSNSSGIGGNFNVHAGAGVGNGNKNPSQSHNCGVRLKTDGGPTRAQEAGRGRNRAASVSPARHSTRTAGGGSSGSSQQQLLNRPSSAPVRERTSRPETAASKAAALRSSMNAALLAASIRTTQQGPGTAAVVPLEFSAAMRNRIQNRIKQHERTTLKVDKVFRGVREMTKEEVEEAQRESRRSRREHLRTAKLLEKQQQQQQQRGGGKLNILPSPTTTTSAVSAVGGVMTAEQQRKQQVTTLTAATLAAHSQVQQMTMKGRQPPPPLLTRGLSSVSFEDDVMAAEGTPTAALAGAEEKSSHKYIGISDYYDGDSAAGAEEGPQLTVKVDPRWVLVYAGNDNSYSVTNLVPDEALLKEPNLRVPVSFCYQVLGADEPVHERSQLSFPVIYHTQPSPSPQQQQQMVVVHSTQKKRHYAQQAQAGGGSMAVTTTATTENEGGGIGSGAPKGMSKTKKEIISAVLSGQQMIQIEKLNSACQSSGVSDTYL